MAQGWDFFVLVSYPKSCDLLSFLVVPTLGASGGTLGFLIAWFGLSLHLAAEGVSLWI